MQIEQGSFRDPSGSIFYENGKIFRSVNSLYLPHYQHLMKSGLYEKLVEEQLLVCHVENGKNPLVLIPERIPFISYPHEWSFTQLKEAALLTLKIQSIASQYGMHLKDASAFNIQFFRGRAIFIDTLSFELKTSSVPWIAYRQFCQHFLGPLALRAYVDWRLKNFSLTHIDGPPLDLIVKLLPWRKLLKPSLFFHLFVHSKFQQRFCSKSTTKAHTDSKIATQALISSLTSAVTSITWDIPNTTWQDYQDGDSYSSQAFSHKERIVEDYLRIAQPQVIWDLGSNEGHFSQLAKKFAREVVSLDGDPVCIDRLFNKKTDILPLIIDFSNPTPFFGWGEKERKSLAARGPADLLLALALVHHLRISLGIPFSQIAEYFSQICTHLIIEFVPLNDKKVQLMNFGETINSNTYNEDLFLKEFMHYFSVEQRSSIEDSERILFLMKTIKEPTCR